MTSPVSNCALTTTANVSWDVLGRVCGERKPALTIASHTRPQKWVMFWCVIFDTWTHPLVISFTVTTQFYDDDSLQLVMLPFLLRRPELTFQCNNSQPRTARVAINCLQVCFILPWPSWSPELSLIEHILEIMRGRLQPCRNIDDFVQQLETIWCIYFTSF